MSNTKQLTDDYYNRASNTTLTTSLEDDNKDTNILPFGQIQMGYDASPIGSRYPAKIHSNSSPSGNVLSQIKSQRNESEKMTLPAQLANLSSPNGKPFLHLDTNFNDVLFSPTDFQMPSSAVESAPGSSPTKSNSKREKPKGHTPRPSNSFILYRREKHIEIMAQYKGVKTLNNNVISKIVANMWRSETPEVKAHFAGLADAEKQAHLLKYPDYKYRPRKSISKKTSPVRKQAKDISLDQQQILMHQGQGQGQFIESPIGQSHLVRAYGIEQPQMSYMMATPQTTHFQHIHMMDPRMAESNRQYDMMGNERFLLSPRYDDQGKFLQHETLLSPNDFTPWPIGDSMNGVWDLCLDRKPFEKIPE